MASTQLETTTVAAAITHGRNLCKAGSRLYACYDNGSNLVYRYSDDDGVTWSSATTVKSGSGFMPSIWYDAGNTRLNFAYGGGNSSSAGLFYRAITSNVATGTPGALSTEVTIDAGGGNLGVRFPYAFHSASASNERYWIIANKITTATTIETRAWHVDVDTPGDADTAGNWITTNFTDLGANSGTIQHKQGLGVHWTVGGADKVTLIVRNDGGGGSQNWEAVTFDPTAATPTPGSVTTITSSLADTNEWLAQGAQMCVNAKADYLVFGRRDPSTGWDFFKTVNGTTWTNPTGWTDLTMGRCGIALSGSDFFLIHTASYGDLSNSAQALSYRKITTSSDNMGGTTTFSDTNGNGIAVPLDTGTSNLYGLYRGSTASPYTVRSDFVNIGGGGGDTTAPGQASVTVTSVTSTTVVLSATMPTDVDVEQYEVRYLTGTTAPATNRSNGTVSTSPTATTANGVVTPSITGLTTSTRITGRVFVKDVAGNWNTGAIFTAVPVTSPTFVGRFRSDGVTAVATATDPLVDILVWQLATTNFETGGANAHMRARIGTDAATPPTVSTYEIVSSSPTAWQYQNSNGVWTNWPSAGLTSFDWARQIRLVNDTTQSSQFVSIRVEQ